MNGDQHQADRPTTRSPDVPRSSNAARALRWIARRWPSAVAVALSLPGFLTPSSPADTRDLTGSLAGVFLLLPLAYLVLAKLRRRPATWPVVLLGLGLVVLLRVTDLVDPVVVLSVLGVAVLAWGVVDGQLSRDRAFRTQAAAIGGFAVLTFTAIALFPRYPEVAGYLVASVWLLHGVWDLVHLKLDRVVARSFAEWCAVVDILIAVQLVWLVAR